MKSKRWAFAICLLLACALSTTSSARTTDTMYAGYDGLAPGQYISSSNGQYHMIYQTDGALVIYENDWSTVVWSTPPSAPYGYEPVWAWMSWWGGLSVLVNPPDPEESPYWANPGLYCTYYRGEYGVLQDDGNFVVFDDTSTPIWSTNGGCI